jgi:hypothetical protein
MTPFEWVYIHNASAWDCLCPWIIRIFTHFEYHVICGKLKLDTKYLQEIKWRCGWIDLAQDRDCKQEFVI